MSEQNNICQAYNNNKKLDYNPEIEKVIPLNLISYNIRRGRCISQVLILLRAIVGIFVHITSNNSSLRA